MESVAEELSAEIDTAWKIPNASAAGIQRLAKELSKELQAAGLLDMEETFLDGTFASAKKGSGNPRNKT